MAEYPSRTQRLRIAEAASLPDLLAAFESYLADRPGWSSEAFHYWRQCFHRHGIGGRTADELIAAAKVKLANGPNSDPSRSQAEPHKGDGA